MLGCKRAKCFRERPTVSNPRSSSLRTSSEASDHMKPIILLIGKNGQVGGELLRLLPQLGEMVALGLDQLDLSNPTDIPQVNTKSYAATHRQCARTYGC